MADYHEEQILAVNGVDICSDAFGSRSDPAVLLIMGAGASMLLWEEAFCQQLADAGRFVIRYDNRDTGRSTCYPPGAPEYSLQDMADDAAGVLDHYDIAEAHIVGASMGGMITQLVGLNHAQRALSLTPIMSSPNPGAVTDAMAGNPSADGLSAPHQAVLEAAASAATLDWNNAEAVLENRVQMFRILSGSAHPYDESSRRALFQREIDRAVNMQSTQNHGLIVAMSAPWHEQLGNIQKPVLVVHGTEDPILPYDHGQAIANSIAGAQLLTMTGVGHELPPAEFDTVISAIVALGG